MTNDTRSATPGPLDVHALSSVATGRSTALFTDDLHAAAGAIRERVQGSRILVIGGAGSIGSATLRVLIPFGPAAVHVVDQDENGLAELVRDLRSAPAPLAVADFRTLPLDYGAPVMRRLLEEEGGYAMILNFAALKHVRSEKDIYSLTQLLDTNLVKQARFLRWMDDLGLATRYFCVSTDKAANPVNLMGASKRVMEHLIFSPLIARPAGCEVTSARFANVAFSAGSLLESFLKRLSRRQPIAVPRQTRRYFVSLEEAGQICLLAASAAPASHIVIPRLDQARDMRELQGIAAGVVEAAGFTPRFLDDEVEAKRSFEAHLRDGRYPIVLTPLDTSGEKPFEEFVADGESAVDIGMRRLEAVPYVEGSRGALRECLARVEALVDGRARGEKADVVRWIDEAVGNFHHVETGKHLDQRM